MNLITGMDFSCWQQGGYWVFGTSFMSTRAAKSALDMVRDEIFCNTIPREDLDVCNFDKDFYGWILSEDDIMQVYMGLRVNKQLQNIDNYI